MSIVRTLVPVLAIGLSACQVGPDYVRPDWPSGEDWLAVEARTATPPAQWWRQFDDPILDGLIEQSLAGNTDLLIAMERIVEARAIRTGLAGLDRPAVQAAGSLARQRQSENGPLPVGRIPGIPVYQTVSDAGLDLNWEIDLFGRIRRTREAADARIEAAEEGRRDLQVMLVAEVARLYFQLRGIESEMASRQATVAAAERTLELVRRRHEVGVGSLFDVRQAELDLAQARARNEPLTGRRTAVATALSALLGERPEQTVERLEASAPLPHLGPVPVGTRADLLRRRPDVRRAERQLAAATAEIGVARGELYPHLRLGASGGFTALDSGDLLESASRRWTLAPVMSWRLLDGGRVHAEIDAAESRQRQAALAYEGAVLRALSEAERGLAAYSSALTAVEHQREAANAATTLRELSDRLQSVGQVSMLQRLEAQRGESQALAALAQARTAATVELTALYRALGGGWEDAAQAASSREAAGVDQSGSVSESF